MIQSFQNKRALLIGNGVNLLDSSQSFSWGALLQELKNTYGIVDTVLFRIGIKCWTTN